MKKSKKEFAEIFHEVLNALDITTYRIAKTLNMGAGPLERLKTGTKPSYETLKSILEAYPQLNPEFILFGEGNVLKEGNSSITEKVSNFEFEDICFLSMEAHTPFIENYESSTPVILEKYPVIRSNESFKECILVEVNDNGMSPIIKYGSKILIRKVDRINWTDMSGVLAILYKDFFVIKRIRENNLNLNKTLTLYSDNRDGGTFTIIGSDIREMWKVLKVYDQIIE